jgi:DUF4097 and DUF4098 domain-containing protein YvlB
VTARKIFLLLFLLGAGLAIEATWSVERHLGFGFGFGPQGCRVLGGRFYGPSWTFEEEGSESAPAAARVEVDNAFGAVHVVAGAPGEVVTRVRKVVFLATEEKAREFAGRVHLRIENVDGRIRVKTNRDEVGRDDRVGLETHLEVRVPGDASVVVRNEHGRVEVQEVAAADVSSSFAGVEVGRIAGAVSVKNRHGSVKVSEVAGDLALDARHGDVEVEAVKGKTRLEVRHGQVGVKGVGGLELDHAHGGVHVEDVAGDLVVKAQHAGVEARDVTGAAAIETSFDGIDVERVGGATRLKAVHGRVRASRVQGTLAAEASYDHVELEDVQGPIEVSVQHGGVQARRVEKGGRVHAAGDDVTVEGFQGALEVTAERADAFLSPKGAITEPLVVRAGRGEIRLEVPAGSRFDLDAETRRGEVHAELPAFEVTERGRRKLTGKLAGGGSAVSLTASGDIHLEPRSTSATNEP